MKLFNTCALLASVFALTPAASGEFQREVEAANWKLGATIFNGVMGQRKLENAIACADAVSAFQADPVFGPIAADYLSEYEANVGSAALDDSCSGDPASLDCEFAWTYPQQDNYTDACEAVGGTVETFGSELTCEADSVAYTISYPFALSCVPPECDDEIDDLTKQAQDNAKDFWEGVTSGKCSFTEVSPSAKPSLFLAAVVVGSHAILSLFM